VRYPVLGLARIWRAKRLRPLLLPITSHRLPADKLVLTRRHEEPGSRDFRNRRLHPDSPLRVGSDVTPKGAKHPATRDVTFRASILPTQEDLTPPSGTGPRLA